MKKSWIKIGLTVLLALFCAGMAAAGQAASSKPTAYSKMLSYVKSKKPKKLDLGQVRYTPAQLLALRRAMPKDGALSFTTTWEGVTFSSADKSIDLKKIRKTPAAGELEAILAVCPKCTYINLYTGRAPKNEVMGALADKYPSVRFNWPIRLGGKYSLSSLATTFSTFIAFRTDPRLEDWEVKNLKYCKYMRALDLGHNHISNLDFLQYMPNLELLILVSTKVIDLTPLSQLKHLKYLEIFATKVNDLRPLAACTELIDLNVDNSRITSLRGLEKLTKLERLWILHCTSVPRAEVNRFRKQHPNCSVNYPGCGRLKKWRDHPRYFHFRWCLKHDRWIPFDQPLPHERKGSVLPAPFPARMAV